MPPKKMAPKAGGKKGPPGAIAAMKAQMEARKKAEEEARRQAEEEEARLEEEERLAEEQRRFEEELAKEEKEDKKKELREQHKNRKKNIQSEAIARMRAAGMIVPDIPPAEERAKEAKEAAKPKPKPKPKKVEVHVDPLASSSDDDELEDDWEKQMEKEERREEKRRLRAERDIRLAEEAKKAKEAEEKAREAAMYGDDLNDFDTDLRSPICCVLGHVDTGKTSLLDKIRATNVQKGEAGGITQQIGATFFPRDGLVRATAALNEKRAVDLKVPGLLVIDTPGHESFTNLRSRGSSLCDIAVLVVDIMHGLENQTRESIQLLKDRKCPFIVALNKVDRLYEWEANEGMDIEQTLGMQKGHVQSEFETRWGNVKTQLAECGLNSELYWRNTDQKRFVSVVPTSAHSGEGISDLLLLKLQLCQKFMEGKVTYKDDLECTLLEVKPIQGIGTTIDVVLVNGTLYEGDKIAVCGLNGPIVTQIRALLTPQPMKELRVRGEYVHHKKVKAALGIKIAANDLEEAVPGTPVYVIKDGEDPKKIMGEVMKDMDSVLGSINKSDLGVVVQSSTLGSLEALMAFLKDSKIPVSQVNLGPIHKRHVTTVVSMRERAPKYSVMLAFDVNVTKEAQDEADKHNIKIFNARIIYHLFDMFTQYCKDYDNMIKEKNRGVAVFPAQLRILDQIRAKDPMILGCAVDRGQLHTGTPLCVIKEIVDPETPIDEDGPDAQTGPELGFAEEPAKKKKEKKKVKKYAIVSIGRVIDVQREMKELKVAKKGMEVAVKINTSDKSLALGRQFDQSDLLVSELTRPAVDALKESFRDEMSEDDWYFIKELMKTQAIPSGDKKKK